MPSAPPDPSTAPSPNGRRDADLAIAAAAGDRAALGEIYDRYAPRIHSLALRLLRDREAAADVTQETFVLAAQRLGGLRDPERLSAWLYAVARHEVVRHVRRSRRDVVTDSIEDYDMPTDTAEGFDRVRGDELRVLLEDTRAGLDDRDRLVLELAYGRQLAGADIAAALGVREDNAHQLLSRARQRLRASLGALLVARQGREDCTELNRLLLGWDGAFSTVWRKRVARHVDRCETCAALERRALSPAALGAAFPVLALPPGLRDRVLSAPEPPAAAEPAVTQWLPDGFPAGGDDDLAVLATRSAGTPVDPVPAGARARPQPVALAVVIVVLALLVVGLLAGGDALAALDPFDGDDAQAQAPAVRSVLATTGPTGPPTESSATVSPSPPGAVPPAPSPPVDPDRPPDTTPSDPPFTTEPAVVDAVLVVRPGGDGDPVRWPAAPGTAVTLSVSHTADAAVDVTVSASPGVTVDDAVVTVAPGGSTSVLVRRGSSSAAPAQAEITMAAAGFAPVVVTIVTDTAQPTPSGSTSDPPASLLLVT
jgi:RNA polymerase sigma factor (sigma-70 family)